MVLDWENLLPESSGAEERAGKCETDESAQLSALAWNRGGTRGGMSKSESNKKRMQNLTEFEEIHNILNSYINQCNYQVSMVQIQICYLFSA